MGRRTAAAASLATVTLLAATLAARGETPPAFDRRCIPARGVASPSNIVEYSQSERLAIGAPRRSRCSPGFHPGLLPAQPPPAQPPGAVNGTPARHLVWRVAKGPRTVAFLVGSVHVLTKAAYPLPPVFDAVFDQSSTLVEEVDLGASGDIAALLPTASGAIFTDGQTLRTVLDPATFRQVESKVATTGMPLALVERMKPWLVSMLLVVPELTRAGFDPAQGLDRHYYDRAKAAGRPVRGLETAAYQVERLNGLPLPVQVEMLKATLDDVEAQVAAVETIVTAWRTGDLATLDRLLLQSFRESPAIYQRLLVDRNRDWVPKIVQCEVEPSPCLVVVGGAHLLGPDGLVALLGAAGFTLAQM